MKFSNLRAGGDRSHLNPAIRQEPLGFMAPAEGLGFDGPVPDHLLQFSEVVVFPQDQKGFFQSEIHLDRIQRVELGLDMASVNMFR